MLVTAVTHIQGGFVEGVYRGTPDEVMAKHFPQATRDPEHPGVYWERVDDDTAPGWYREAWDTFCHEVQD